VLLVANANASGIVRRPELVGDASSLLRAAGARVETCLTTTVDALDELLASAERRVVLLGGDGSLHAAANAPGETPELALLPAGGANNVARSLGVPVDLQAAARLAVAGAARPLDLIAARTASRCHLAVEGVSVGFHALARVGYRGHNSTDRTAAVKAGAAALARFRPLTVGIDADGRSRVLEVGQLFVVNTPLFGPGLKVAPGADTGDGLLDLVTIEARGRIGLLRLIPHLRRGTHLDRPGVNHMAAERIRISSGGRSPVVADTTDLGAGMVDIQVVPGALSVVQATR
jgi:diacylglycerol kinase (ATP)